MKSQWIVTFWTTTYKIRELYFGSHFPIIVVKEGLQEFATKHVNIVVARIPGKRNKKLIIQPRIFRPKSCGFTPSTDRTKVKKPVDSSSINLCFPITSPFSDGLNMARFQRVFWMAFGWVSMYFASFCTCEKSPHLKSNLNEEPFQGHMAFREIRVGWWWDKLTISY